MAKARGFSLYDIEQFLRDAGAERVNEEAVTALERELEDTVKELASEAQVYANYAGRKRLINGSDIAMVKSNGRSALAKRRAALVRGHGGRAARMRFKVRRHADWE